MQNRELKKILALLFYPLLFLGIIWSVLALEWFFGLDLAKYGTYPRQLTGLRGIVFSPFLHSDATHAFNNSIPILVLMIFIQMFYRGIAFSVFLWSFFVSGFLVWVFARPSYHIGASGLVYAFVSFVFFSGIFSKNIPFIAVSLVVSFLYGSLIWGIFPLQEDLSWESHLIGGLVGVSLAFRYHSLFKKSEKTDAFSNQSFFPYWKYGQEIHLPNFKLDPLGNLSRLAIHYGILDFWTAINVVSTLPYGRIKERSSFESILIENKGTCSSKHAFLYELARENNHTNIHLVMGIYQMNKHNTKGVGIVLSKYGLDYLPEAHVYLKYKRWRLDFTFPNSLSLFEDSLMQESQIQSHLIGSYKAKVHKEFLSQWIQKLNLDYSIEEIWQIREECIQVLGSKAF